MMFDDRENDGEAVEIELKWGTDIKQTAQFVAALNRRAEDHVGYCPLDFREIERDLLSGFSDFPLSDSLAIAYVDNEMAGVLGLDIEADTREAEIWGPFIRHSSWQRVAFELWNGLAKKNRSIVKRLNGFYHRRNHRCLQFMTMLGGEVKGRHTVLSILRSEFMAPSHSDLQEVPKKCYESFISLHNQSFPYSYFDGEEIVRRLNERNKLFGFVEGGELKGYVYVEGDPVFGKGSIEYAAVAPESRNRGIGSLLIRQGIEFLFASEGVQSIQLCVSIENKKALKLYKSVGFKEKQRLVHFVLDKW